MFDVVFAAVTVVGLLVTAFGNLLFSDKNELEF